MPATLDSTRYGAVLAEHLYSPKLIDSEREYKKARQTLERLLFPERRLPAEEDALAKLLLHLVGLYEDRATDASLPASAGPVEVLRHLMEQRGLLQLDLIGVLGPASVVSEVLSGKRRINAGQARRLSEYFDIGIDLFLA